MLRKVCRRCTIVELLSILSSHYKFVQCCLLFLLIFVDALIYFVNSECEFQICIYHNGKYYQRLEEKEKLLE